MTCLKLDESALPAAEKLIILAFVHCGSWIPLFVHEVRTKHVTPLMRFWGYVSAPGAGLRVHRMQSYTACRATRGLHRTESTPLAELHRLRSYKRPTPLAELSWKRCRPLAEQLSSECSHPLHGTDSRAKGGAPREAEAQSSR